MRFAKNISRDSAKAAPRREKERSGAEIEEKLLEAKSGYRYFKRLLHEQHAERCVLFLDNELWQTGVRWFDAFFAAQGGCRWLLAFANETQMAAAKQTIRAEVRRIVLPPERISQILRAFAMINMTRELTVVSLMEPYDTHGMNMLGKKGTTQDELVCMDIFKLDMVSGIAEEIHA